jgi:hypothetical protein
VPGPAPAAPVVPALFHEPLVDVEPVEDALEIVHPIAQATELPPDVPGYLLTPSKAMVLGGLFVLGLLLAFCAGLLLGYVLFRTPPAGRTGHRGAPGPRVVQAERDPRGGRSARQTSEVWKTSEVWLAYLAAPGQEGLHG